jgi:hypothetical protein
LPAPIKHTSDDAVGAGFNPSLHPITSYDAVWRIEKHIPLTEHIMAAFDGQ